jgi:tartrate dehydratase beta subunit/fumarate hydratase class I family protein
MSVQIHYVGGGWYHISKKGTFTVARGRDNAEAKAQELLHQPTKPPVDIHKVYEGFIKKDQSWHLHH